MLDDMLNPDGLFSLYDVRGYDLVLKCVGYRVFPFLTMYGCHGYCSYDNVGYRIVLLCLMNLLPLNLFLF